MFNVAVDVNDVEGLLEVILILYPVPEGESLGISPVISEIVVSFTLPNIVGEVNEPLASDIVILKVFPGL